MELEFWLPPFVNNVPGVMAESEDVLGSGLWSDLKTLEQVAAMNCLPSLVRLESGYYGQVEELSFSQGDFLALQTCVVLNGQHIFLAHYMVSVHLSRSMSYLLPLLFH